MPPNQDVMNVMTTNSAERLDNIPQSEDDKRHISSDVKIEQPIVWFNVVGLTVFHIVVVVSFFLNVHKMKLLTLLWIYVYTGFSGLGVTAGAHRLWSHRSYKAKLPLKVLLLICYSAAGMNSLLDWVRDHRVHHKYSETDADPHNAKRGFFFSHIGWLMRKKHPEVIRKGQNLDFRDISEDPLLKFHYRYFQLFRIVFCFVLPVYIPMHFWNETFTNALCSQAFRYMLLLNGAWSVNSAAHIWGKKPYDRRLGPVENIGVSIATIGEGWHNYHHAFPWDYKAAELGNYKLNLTTMWLDFFLKIGLAYDAKQPSAELVKTMIQKYGDGSHVPEIRPECEEKFE